MIIISWGCMRLDMKGTDDVCLPLQNKRCMLSSWWVWSVRVILCVCVA